MAGKPQHRAVQLMLPKIDKMDIQFENLTYTADQGKKKKEILHSINGTFKSGELTGIMGPSGAGKSTLLNIISGFQKKGLKGTIRTNDENKHNIKVKYKKDSCYILQDDRLCPLFTVEEIMMMATKLKLGYSITTKAKEMLIFDILDTLGLTNCMDTRCGKLSGGQRKRLSIALELIDNPPIMFLDEPTTGLDSSSSLQCITTLKSLSQGGRTIVCTIHQPSATIFEMFDHIYILAGGHCIYQGAPELTVNYLSSVGLNCPQYHNPADYMLEVANEEYGKFNDILSKISSNKSWRIEEKPPIKISDDERESSNNKTMILVNSPSEMYKFWVLLHRSVLQLYRDWTLCHFRLALNIVVGIFIGLLYQGFGNDGSKCMKNVGYFVVSITYFVFTTMIPAALKVPLEIPILKKECFNNWYNLSSYYFSILIAPLPMQIFNVILYTLISSTISSQRFEYQRIIMVTIILFLVLLTAEGLGLTIGILLNPINGTFVASTMTAVHLGLSGFLMLFSHMSKPMYLLSYTSYIAYGVEGLVVAMYGHGRAPLECPKDHIYCHHKYPSTFLKDIGLERAEYKNDILFLIGCIILTRVLAYVSLRRRLKNNLD